MIFDDIFFLEIKIIPRITIGMNIGIKIIFCDRKCASISPVAQFIFHKLDLTYANEIKTIIKNERINADLSLPINFLRIIQWINRIPTENNIGKTISCKCSPVYFLEKVIKMVMLQIEKYEMEISFQYFL